MARGGGKPKTDAGAQALERARDALYEVPPKAFTAERNERVKQLVEAGHGAEASELEKERRRPASVWVVNKLARSQPDAVKSLLEAGSELRRAQRRALSGAGGEALREATTRMRSEVRATLPTLRRLLNEAGASSSATVLERARQTLLSASPGNDEVRDALQRGRIEEDLSPVGFGDVAGLRLVTPPPRPSSARPERRTESDAARRKREVAEERARKAALKRAAGAAHRELDRRQKELTHAMAERDRLEKLAQAAEARARQARATADAAAREFEAAQNAEAQARRNAEAADASLKG